MTPDASTPETFYRQRIVSVPSSREGSHGGIGVGSSAVPDAHPSSLTRS